MTRQELHRLREWADGQIAAGQDATWIWYQYMKLREALDGVIASMECAHLQSDGAIQFAESGPHLVVSNDRPDAVQRSKSAGVIALQPRKFGV